MGVSSNKALRVDLCEAVVVSVPTRFGLDIAFVIARVLRIVPAKESGDSARPKRGVSGDSDGKEMSERSEAAIDDAELDGCEGILRFLDGFLDFARTECPRRLLFDAAESCEVVRSRAACGGEMVPGVVRASGDVAMVVDVYDAGGV